MAALCFLLTFLLAQSLWTSALEDEFLQAATNGDLAAVRFYLDLGVSADQMVVGDDGTGTGFADSALVRAARNRHLEIVRLLLERGAPPNQVAWPGTTALMLAATREDFPMVELLIDYGADPGSGSGEDSLPAEEAVKRNPRLRELFDAARPK